MFYAWPTAVDFSNGTKPVTRAQSESAIIRKMEGRYKKFFTAMLIDGTWVDLTVYGTGIPEGGRSVSESRTTRYVRSRKRVLEAEGKDEVNQNTTLLHADAVESSEMATSPEEPQSGVPEGDGPTPVVLTVEASKLKAIFEFLMLEPEQRDTAINTLYALSSSAEAFKGAIAVVVDPSQQLIVEMANTPETEQES